MLIAVEGECLDLSEAIEHPERFQEQIFQELKDFEEQESKEALELLGMQAQVGKIREGKGSSRDFYLQEWEPSGAESGFAVATDGSSFCSCSPSMANDADEAMSTSSRKSLHGKERDWWSADLEGELEKLEVEGNFSVAEGGSMDPERKADHWSVRKVLTKTRDREMEVDEVIPGTQPSSKETDGFIMCEVEEQQTARVEVQDAQRRVKNGGTYLRESLAISQEEADEIGFVPSALSVPQGVYCW